MPTIKDRDFGTVEQDEYSLTRPFKVTIFGETRTVELDISGPDDDGGVEEHQRVAFRQLDREKNRFCADAEDEIFKYYKSVVDEIRADRGDSADEDMPLISSKNELKRMLSLESIVINMGYGEVEQEIGFLFECTWEPEHGLAARFLKGKCVEIGFQDIVL